MEKNDRATNLAGNVLLGLIGVLITGLIAFISGSWISAMVYGLIVSGIIWIFIQTPIGGMFVDFMMMFFAWCAGIPRADIAEMSHKDQLIYARTGATLFVPTTLAFAGALTVAVDVYQVGLGSALALAVIWAWIIFTIDAALIATMKRDREMKYPLSSLLIRAILAFSLGILISAVLELRIFKSEIHQEFTEQLESTNKRLDSVQAAEIAILQSRLDEGQATVDAREQEMRKEIDQSIAGRVGGYGSVAKKKETLWMEARSEFETKIRPEVQAQIKEKKEYYQEKRDKVTETFSDGIASRLEYLHDAGEKHPVIAMAHLFLFLFLIALELIPVLTKMMAPPTEYDFKKAQLTYEKELETYSKKMSVMNTERNHWDFDQETFLQKQQKRQAVKEKLETQRIEAILTDMQNVDTAAKNLGRNLDDQFDVVSNRISEENKDDKESSLWFWQKRGKSVA